MISIDLSGKVAVVTGVANRRSIAFAIAGALHAAGARIVLTYQGERIEESVRALAPEVGGAAALPCDVTSDAEMDALFAAVEREAGGLDILVHSIAFAGREEFEAPFENASRAGFLRAAEVSAFSLVALARRAAPLMEKRGGGAVVCLTFLGGERVVPGYKVMGPAKALLEANTRYLAESLGRRNVRVNAVSAGPLRTLSLAGIPGGRDLLATLSEKNPLGRPITLEEVAHAALFLLSPLASGVTGETLHVDAGYHVLGMYPA
ncbi:MAG: enoyl-ACP reductase [Planctomycetes bacterium]|nr:enoyl-ACP reductase [Planctomycetota bacterium]